MSGDIGSLSIKLLANIADYVEGMTRAEHATAQSAREMQRSLEGIERNADKLIGAIKGVAAAALAGFTLDKMKQEFDKTIAMAAQLDDLAETVGGTVERLSQLAEVAHESGAPMELLSASLQRLAKGMSGADDEGTATARALTAMKISATDATGALKNTDDLFVEIAKTMATYKDGTEKTALAIALFGRGGAALLPLLKDLAEKGELNVKVTTQQAAEAEKYQKALARLAEQKNDLMRTITFGVLPAAMSFVGALEDLGKEANAAGGGLKQLKEEGKITEWANAVAIGAAIIIDTFRALGNAAIAVGSSFQVVGADIKAMWSSIALMHGAGLQQWVEAWSAREKTLESASKKWAALADMDLNKVENYVRNRQKWERELSSITFDFAPEPQERAPIVPGKPGKSPTIRAEKPEEIRGLADALKYLGQIEAEMVGIDRTYYDSMMKLSLIYQHQPEELERVAAAQKYLMDQRRRALEAPVLKANEEYNKAMREQRATINDAADALKKYTDREFTRLDAGKQTLAQLAEQKFAQEANSIISAAWLRIMDQMGGDVLPEVVVQFVKMNDEAKKNAKVFGDRSGVQAAEDLLKAIQDETAALLLDNAAREEGIIKRQLEHLGLVQGTQDYERIAAAIKSSLDARRYASELKDLTGQLTDAVLASFEGGEGAIKRIIAILKAEFARLVLRPIIEPIMGSFASIVLGIMGIGTSGGASGAVGGIQTLAGLSSFASMGTNLWNTAGAAYAWLQGGDMAAGFVGPPNTSFFSAGGFGNPYTAGGLLGTAALGYAAGSFLGPMISEDEDAARNAGYAGAAGAVIGSYIATGTSVGGPWGAVIGAVIGILAAAFSDMEGPAMRTARVVAGQELAKYTYYAESKLGTIGIERGSDKWFSDSDMGQQLTMWFKALTDIDNSIADRLSPEQLTSARAAVASYGAEYEFGIEHQEIRPETWGEIVQDRYTRVFSSFNTAMGDLIKNFDGTTEDLLRLVDDLATVNYVLTHDAKQLRALFEEDITFEKIAALKRENETYAATLERLGNVYYATNAFAEMVGKTQEEVWGAVGLASLEAREALVEAAGGLKNLTDALSSYYNHYYTAEEKRARLMAQVSGVFADLNIEMPTTIGGFRQLVDDIINGVNPALSLQTEAGRALLMSLLGVEDEFWQLFGSADSAGGAIDDLAKKIAEWEARVKEASDTIRESIGESIRSLTIGGLSGPELESFYRSEYETALGFAEAATTPEEITRWVDEAKGALLDWFNSLSEDQQDAQRAWFIAQLGGLGGLAQSWLGSLTMPEDGMTPAAQATMNSESAQQQKDAAKMQADAASAQATAAAVAYAAATIQRILTINIPALGVTAEVGV